MASSKKVRTPGDHSCVLLQMLMDIRVYVSITRILTINSLSENMANARYGTSNRYSGWRGIHNCSRRTEHLRANTNSKEGISQNGIRNFERQSRLLSLALRHSQRSLGILT